jgi:hypothetical protein
VTHLVVCDTGPLLHLSEAGAGLVTPSVVIVDMGLDWVLHAILFVVIDHGGGGIGVAGHGHDPFQRLTARDRLGDGRVPQAVGGFAADHAGLFHVADHQTAKDGLGLHDRIVHDHGLFRLFEASLALILQHQGDFLKS